MYPQTYMQREREERAKNKIKKLKNFLNWCGMFLLSLCAVFVLWFCAVVAILM